MKNFRQLSIQDHIEGFLEVFDMMEDDEVIQEASEKGMGQLGISAAKTTLILQCVLNFTTFTEADFWEVIREEYPELL